jgi:hypothetical protein
MGPGTCPRRSYVQHGPRQVVYIRQIGPGLCCAEVFVTMHIHPAPQHVDPTHAAWRASEAILSALRGYLCRILHLNFREFTFYEVR